MSFILPGQKKEVSAQLQELLDHTGRECKKKIVFSGSAKRNYVGRIEWNVDDVHVEVDGTLSYEMAEYIAAHELAHIIQLATGCVIASGRLDEPGAVHVAGCISDFLLDPMADTIAREFALPMASCFNAWIESTGILNVFQHRRKGRIYGDDWHRAWEWMAEDRVRKQLGLVQPKIPRDFWTMHVSLDFAKIVCRADNLGVDIGKDILEGVKKDKLLNVIIHDLIEIGCVTSTEESVFKTKAILAYFKVEPRHIQINRPLTQELLINGKWQQPAQNDQSLMEWIS